MDKSLLIAKANNLFSSMSEDNMLYIVQLMSKMLKGSAPEEIKKQEAFLNLQQLKKPVYREIDYASELAEYRREKYGENIN